MFDFESSVEKMLVSSQRSAEEVWPHAGVQILAHLERDFDFSESGGDTCSVT